MTRDHTSPLRLRPLAMLFMGEVVALTVFNTPLERLTRYICNDSGADLTIAALVARGLRPTIDFAYIYGLLPLAITGAWQDVLGANPTALRLAALACNLLLAWGLARLVVSARIGAVGVGLIVLAIPDMLQSSMIVLVQTLEPVLLVHALAFQARGKRSAALALATADLLVKPAMAYLYGFLLVVAIVLDPAQRSRWRQVLAPAAATGAGLAIVLGLLYGFRPLVNTLVPGGGLEVYRQNHYGFFRGVGRAFWLLPGATVRDYLRYEVGAWLAGTAVLGAGGVVALGRIARRHGSTVDEVVLTCLGLHAGFVCLFYGNRMSWVYYYAVLVAGLAAMDTRQHAAPARGLDGLGRRRWQTVAVGLVALLTLVGSKVKFETTARLWRTDTPVGGTLGLWASPAERQEWLTVMTMCLAETRQGAGKPVLLARVEGAAVLLPSTFARPQTAYLVPGHAIEPELKRKADQIAAAPLVVCARPRSGYERWPVIAHALEGFQPVWEGEFFEVDRRKAESVSPPSRPGNSRR